MGAGIKSNRGCDFRDGKVGGFKQFFGFVAAYRIQEFDDGNAVFLLKRVRDIILIQEEELGKLVKGDIFLITGAQIQMDLAQRVGFCRGVEGQGDKLGIPQQKQYKIIELVDDGVLPKGCLLDVFPLNYF